MAQLTIPDTAPPAAGLAPHEVFLEWLETAASSGIEEAHICVVATALAGRPDARVVVLRDVTDSGWWFSGPEFSPKGVALKANPAASMAFYWREHGRQVRVSGAVSAGDSDVAARDFRDRSPTARAVAAASRQSEVLRSDDDYRGAVDRAAARVAADPDHVPEHWRAWCLEPETVEFWQADPGRRHLRWRYRREDAGWVRDVLWP
ncbi:pyridoxal 5'-phosphate synthase [Antrihabitans sp. YC2-6]|uniref:pyridoxine/pyridoxamine 5'-phosphate oxidase n=1 Tax=Antrihabitans sp. YC2-6 TaxID=2799498 RepID=UPI0018F69413|nr:pyridoxal 5'-phosphate synthase [Antrihabitans sp. YC2-6]MBJ8344033.1 pyridoxal 5'-phosphate synthase [Antrihabitans sp. YC2-6]